MSHSSLKLFTGLVGALLFGMTAQASSPYSFTYQGDLLLLNGDPSNATVDFRFQIYDPSGTCLLYEELQTSVDLSLTNGHFALSVGSPVASGKRTANDHGLEMHALFSNAPVQILAAASPNCASGYTPAAGDQRKLRVIVGGDTLSPDQVINAVPYATVAETIQGKGPADFVQHTVVNMQTLVEDLVNGTSNLYLRADGSNAVAPVPMNNQRVTSVADPVNAQDAATKNYSDTMLGGQSIAAGVPADGEVLTWNSAAGEWQYAGIQAHAKATAPACAGGQASHWNGSAWSCVSVGGGGSNGGVIHSGTYEVIVLSNASAKNHATNHTEGVTFQLPDATTMSLGGPHFSIFNNNTNSNLVIPVLDANGKYVTGIGTGTKKDFYLFDNGTAAGTWQTENVNSHQTGLEKLVIEPSGSSDSSNNVRFDLIPGTTNSYIMTYYRNGLYARAASVNHATQAVTWGAEVGISTIANGNLEVVALSTTKAAVFYGNSPYKGAILNISGLSITPSAETSGLPYCSGRKRMNANVVGCVGSGSCTSRPLQWFDVSGTTVANGGSLSVTTGGSCADGLTVERIDDSQAVVYYGEGGVGLIARHLTISGWTMGAAATLETYNISPYSSSYRPGQSTVRAISGTEFALSVSDSSYSNPHKLYRIGISGSTLTKNQTVTAAPGSGMGGYSSFFDAGGNTYVATEENSNVGRRQVTAIGSLSLNPSEKSFNCYGHVYDIGKCLKGENIGGFPDSINRAGFRFEIGH